MLLLAAAEDGHAQEANPTQQEVDYVNAADGTPLSGYLSVPTGVDESPGVVLLSIAGTEVVTQSLVEAGYAVLAPIRRGFVSVDPLLRATYADLGGDLRAALDYLGSLPEVDSGRLVVIAQADDAPPAMLAMASSSSPIPLLLVAPPAFSGVQEFRREQMGLARRDGAGGDELLALDRYIDQIAAIALSDAQPYVREYRLGVLREASSVDLPRNAAFPMDERQARFLASPLWRDRLSFEPQRVLASLRSPVMVVIGEEEANTPIEAYVDSVRRGFTAGSREASVCIVPGRTRHSFSPRTIDVVVRWVDARLREAAPAEPMCREELPG